MQAIATTTKQKQQQILEQKTLIQSQEFPEQEQQTSVSRFNVGLELRDFKKPDNVLKSKIQVKVLKKRPETTTPKTSTSNIQINVLKKSPNKSPSLMGEKKNRFGVKVGIRMKVNRENVSNIPVTRIQKSEKREKSAFDIAKSENPFILAAATKINEENKALRENLKNNLLGNVKKFVRDQQAILSKLKNIEIDEESLENIQKELSAVREIQEKLERNDVNELDALNEMNKQFQSFSFKTNEPILKALREKYTEQKDDPEPVKNLKKKILTVLAENTLLQTLEFIELFDLSLKNAESFIKYEYERMSSVFQNEKTKLIEQEKEKLKLLTEKDEAILMKLDQKENEINLERARILELEKRSKEQIETERRKFEEERSRFDKQIRDKQTELEKSKSEKLQAENNLNKALRDLEEAKNANIERTSKLEETIKIVNQSLIQKTNEINRLTNENKNLERDKKALESKNKSVAELQKENENLRKEFELETKKYYDTVKILRETYDVTKNGEIAELKDKFKRTEEFNQRSQEEELNKLRKELEQEKLKSSGAVNEVQRKYDEQLKAARKKFEEDQVSLEKKKNEEINELNNQIELLEASKDNEEIEKEELNNEIKKNKLELEKAKKELEIFQANFSEAFSNLAKTNVKITDNYVKLKFDKILQLTFQKTQKQFEAKKERDPVKQKQFQEEIKNLDNEISKAEQDFNFVTDSRNIGVISTTNIEQIEKKKK